MKRLLSFALASAFPLAASAQLYTETFDVDHTANWSFNSSIAGDTAANNSGGEANFFFDYSTVGIASAPHSTGGTTFGLKMEANVVGTAIFSGMSASPLGQSFSGDYRLSFDAWQNFLGPLPGGGSGTTQCLHGGIQVADTVAQFPGGTENGVAFAATADGGSGNDYRAYSAAGSPYTDTSGVYAAGNVAGVTNNSHPYYSTFQGSVPGAQTAIAAGPPYNFAGQTGITNVGVVGFAWRYWEIEKNGFIVTWKVDGKLIATVDTTNLTPRGGTNIFVGQFDVNTTSSTDPLSRTFSFGLVDNIRVDAVPEPTTMAVLGLGAAALLRRRRK